MSAWIGNGNYHSLLILAAGLLTYAGVVGVGTIAMKALHQFMPSPWEPVVSVLAGVQLMSLGVQVLGMTSAASRRLLLAWLCLFWIAGLLRLVHWMRTFAAWRDRTPRRYPLFAVAGPLVIAITLATNLVIAVAPSTKADEIYYHMLVPARVVHDHALHQYLFPLLAASLPQLGYQLAAAPLHAASLPDALNVVSWALSATLFWFCYRLLREKHSVTWASTWCAAMAVGLHTAVWHVTGGSHAMGELALAALLIAVAVPDALLERSTARAFAFAIGICASAAAMSKISTMPIAAALLLVGVVRAHRHERGHGSFSIVPFAVAPGLVFLLPIVAWTWRAFGAPLGPLLSWWFPGSAYASLHIREQLVRESYPILELATRHSPLLWIGVAGAPVASRLPRSGRLLLASALVAQLVLIRAQLPLDPRFLGGLTFGAATIFALRPPPRWRGAMAGPARRWVALMLLVVPWCLLSLYYARPFAAVVAGLTSREAFLERYVAYESDYVRLDALLPRDAVLYVPDQTKLSVYAPRTTAWLPSDIPGSVPIYQFGRECESLDTKFVAAEIVYRNPVARVKVFRDPRRVPLEGPLCVRRLLPAATVP